MIFTSLPKELKEIVYSYAFGECNLCHKCIHYSNLVHNCRIFEYRNVFQDEYWNKDEIITLRSICKQCITSFGGKIIVNFKDNTYFWIKDYDTDKYLMHTKNIT
jgi:hypothetical protein